MPRKEDTASRTGFIFVIEVDGEQHFFNDINQRRRDREKLDFLTAEPPDCVDKIHFICRISYQQRRRGHAAIRELLSRVVASSMDGFVCLKDDGMLYDADGMPRILRVRHPEDLPVPPWG